MTTNSLESPFDLTRDNEGRLVLVDRDGVRHIDVASIRSFPVSDPDHWISICDRHGRELALVRDLGALPTLMREMLEDDLSRREFVPVIRRVLSMPADSEPTEWDVETDRGRTQFVLKTADDVRRLSSERALVVDSQGTRYLIDNLDALDTASRRVLERYL